MDPWTMDMFNGPSRLAQLEVGMVGPQAHEVLRSHRQILNLRKMVEIVSIFCLIHIVAAG